MNGREADGQVLASEQHAEARDTEGIGKKFCLAGEAKSHGLELVLADRCGDHGSGFADFEFESGVLQALECGFSGPLVWLAGCASLTVADDFKLVVLRYLCRCKGLIDNFRADAGGVADGDKDACHIQRFPSCDVLPSHNRLNFKSHGLPKLCFHGTQIAALWMSQKSYFRLSAVRP